MNGAADADDGRDVGPVEQDIAGHSLSGLLCALQHIFQVVDDLVAEAPEERDALEQLKLAGRGAAQHRRQHQRQPDQRNRLAPRNSLGGLAVVRGKVE